MKKTVLREVREMKRFKVIGVLCILLTITASTVHLDYGTKLQSLDPLHHNIILMSNDLEPKHVVDPYPESSNELDKLKFYYPSLTDEELRSMLRTSTWEELLERRLDDSV